MLLVANEIVEHARVGRAAFNARRFADAKYQRDCCALLLWRLSVDGMTADGQLKLDGAKWETRLPGRLSSAAARAIRDSPELTNRSQSALVGHLEPDHIVPRNCVAEVLIRPDWLDLDDLKTTLGFLNSHAEIAVLAPRENQKLADSGLKSKMPASWWDAPLVEKLCSPLRAIRGC
jgi:hypothetical protein